MGLQVFHDSLLCACGKPHFHLSPDDDSPYPLPSAYAALVSDLKSVSVHTMGKDEFESFAKRLEEVWQLYMDTAQNTYCKVRNDPRT